MRKQTAFHNTSIFPFKIMCCVDLLRSPGQSGHNQAKSGHSNDSRSSCLALGQCQLVVRRSETALRVTGSASKWRYIARNEVDRDVDDAWKIAPRPLPIHHRNGRSGTMSRLCTWCGIAYEPRSNGGSAQRFCSAPCRRAFDSACRIWAAAEYDAERVSTSTLRTALHQRARCLESNPAPERGNAPQSGNCTGGPAGDQAEATL